VRGAQAFGDDGLVTTRHFAPRAASVRTTAASGLSHLGAPVHFANAPHGDAALLGVSGAVSLAKLDLQTPLDLAFALARLLDDPVGNAVLVAEAAMLASLLAAFDCALDDDSVLAAESFGRSSPLTALRLADSKTTVGRTQPALLDLGRAVRDGARLAAAVLFTLAMTPRQLLAVCLGASMPSAVLCAQSTPASNRRAAFVLAWPSASVTNTLPLELDLLGTSRMLAMLPCFRGGLALV
jgi:hypothetical protein